jgi:hypothetical protein
VNFITDRPCDKLAVVTALVKGNSVSANGTRGCGGKSSDALLIKYCSAPPSTQWKRGMHVGHKGRKSYYTCKHCL